ncbi:RHS repeat-associated core domain-containing protein [Bradyrhizobium neotropicale]|uniref:Teneurin-like YD-shell domain-containing protein n=1 Tax=Bradyrhizobium neotropicale TaxID=1497615 RepID=A0A176ZH09_9BRAD|nr:hypothetical protein AXW67_35105 [Bradyrhizobium neotropicale]
MMQKTYPDTSTSTYTYESTTSRLRSVLDALGQTKQYGYAQDNLLTSITYLNTVNATPSLTFAYDPYLRRRTSMTDGTGSTSYTYVPIGSLGALQLQQESGPVPNSTIVYAYDAMQRLASRTVAGAGAETFGYDPIDRLTSHASDLGAFTLSYLGQTSQTTQRRMANTTLSTEWSYLPNSGDRRLSGITNIGLSSGQLSAYGYSTTSENFISAISETSDTAPVYPSPLTQTVSYNNLNQLTNLSGQPLTFDANGNLLSDGQRTYAWDAENRLININYPGQSGKQIAFLYDGLNRRTAIVSTPAGVGNATTTSYLWCGATICQARNGSNTPIRSYYVEGEFVPGLPAQPYYYGTDQIGSVRRIFASATNAPGYNYDPYGLPLQSPPLSDFSYGGMLYSADSGLYLTQYRIYDPAAGRWLSRDPIDSQSVQIGADPTIGSYSQRSQDASKWASSSINVIPEVGTVTWPNEANLYAYVDGNPISFTDPTGEATRGEKIAAFIRFCLALLKFNHPDVEVPPPVQQPVPRISEPSGPPPQLPKPPAAGKGPPPPNPPAPPISY